MHTQIAIDGPVASGKTVVGRILSEQLGWRFLDTGLMYRAITWMALHEQIDASDHLALENLAINSQIELVASSEGDRLFINQNDITDDLRSRSIEATVSFISQISGVRTALILKQREIASSGSIVMVGRDIGTRVLKYAGIKVFLTASTDERAKRRFSQALEIDPDTTLKIVKTDLERRDLIDSQNKESPLLPADDSVIINTDNMEIDEVVQKIMQLLKTK